METKTSNNHETGKLQQGVVGRSADYDDDYDEEPEFIPCSECDGHPACEDFGCAFENGCGHLVKRDITREW